MRTWSLGPRLGRGLPSGHDCGPQDKGEVLNKYPTRLEDMIISAGRTSEENAATDLPAKAVTGIIHRDILFPAPLLTSVRPSKLGR